MANIVIKEILASDTVSDLVDKVNFNFDQLLLNGGGPAGPIGGSGPAGPLGPRGSIWFTANDIYNTSTTTTPDPPLVFPLWSGTPQKVNNPALPGYPQFALDPNRYLPAAETVTGTYPENSFIIGTTGKTPRSGDLYLQETDDTFDSFSSTDGDIWEFNGVNQTWTYTGVNIKGDTGTTGANGFTEWVRTNDASPALNDFLRPEIITANDPIVRVVIGVGDATQASDIITDGSVYTDNVLTLFSEAPSPGNPQSYRSQIALTDEYSIQAPASSTYDYANIYTVNNTLNLYGFNDAGATNDNYNVNVVARSGNVLLESINTVLTSTQSALLNTNSRQFEITNGALSVSVPPVTPSSANTGGSIVTHRLADTSVALDITHNSNLSSSYTGYWPIGSQGKSIRLLTTDQNSGASQTYLNLQTFANGRIGIGYFGAPGINNVNGKLAINGGSAYPSGIAPNNILYAGVVIGNTWSNSSSITFNRIDVGGAEVGITGNSIFFEGQLSSARNPASTTALYNFGPSTLNSINVYSSVNIQQGMIGFNTYKPEGTLTLASTGSTQAGGQWYIGPGSWLHANINTAIATDNLVNSLVIGGNTVNATGIGTPYTALRTSIMIDATTQQVLLNSQARYTPAGSVLMPNFVSHGGAIIGKTRPSNISPFNTHFGHEDAISNKNIIIGFSLGTENFSPRIKTNVPGDSLTTSRTNHTYIGTPVFIGSLNFDQSTELKTATNTSKTSFSGNKYNTYLPSYYSQNKIVHGIITSTQDVFDLQNASNPYNTGVGLEIETRIAVQTPTSPISVYRTPVVRNASGQVVEGNRPLLITKRGIDSGGIYTLLEATPFNNISIGEPLKYPDLAVAVGDTTAKDGNLSGSFSNYYGSLSGLVNTVNAGRWYNINNGTSVATPLFDRSLHVNGVSGIFNGQYEFDQTLATLSAGIVINTGPIIVSGTNVGNVSNSWKNYRKLLKPYTHAITTPVYSFQKGTYSAAASYPLGIKPGWTLYDSTGPGLATSIPSLIQGTDTVIEGGDVVYVRGLAQNATYAGNVYISGGQIYEDTLGNAGDGNARSAFNTPQSYPYGAYGSVFLGSKITQLDGLGTSYANQGVARSGLVYVGYDFNDILNVESTPTVYMAKGKASLNVSASATNIETVRDSVNQRSEGRAINIQRGDIVTKDQAAGWTEINLRNSQFFNLQFQQGPNFYFQSENIFCYNGTNIPGIFITPVSAGLNYGIDPQWKIRYKVIGYTVHYIISLVGIRWRVVSGQPDADIVFISNANDLFSTNPATSLLPRPRFITSNAYTSGSPQSYNLPFNDTLASFSGSGHMIMHQSPDDVNFPWQTDPLSPMTVTPIAAAYDRSQDRITIYKSGGSMFVADHSNSAYGNTAVVDTLLSRFLIPISGRAIGGVVTGAAGTQIPVDIYISGTYELDPQYWFPS